MANVGADKLGKPGQIQTTRASEVAIIKMLLCVVFTILKSFCRCCDNIGLFFISPQEFPFSSQERGLGGEFLSRSDATTAANAAF